MVSHYSHLPLPLAVSHCDWVIECASIKLKSSADLHNNPAANFAFFFWLLLLLLVQVVEEEGMLLQLVVTTHQSRLLML